MTQKLSEAQTKFLSIMARSPRGRVLVSSADGLAMLDTLTWTDLVSDVYEVIGGARTATITEAGRAALESRP